jgi:hypothetical protein
LGESIEVEEDDSAGTAETRRMFVSRGASMWAGNARRTAPIAIASCVVVGEAGIDGESARLPW